LIKIIGVNSGNFGGNPRKRRKLRKESQILRKMKDDFLLNVTKFDEEFPLL